MSTSDNDITHLLPVGPPPLTTLPLTPPPTYKLYTPSGVGLATFLGSPIAGSVLMAINYRRLGNRAAAGKAAALGFLGTIALASVAALLPQPISMGLGIGAWIGMNSLAKAFQGEQIIQHTARGGELASNWRAAGVSLLVTLFLCITLIGSYFAFGEQGRKLEVMPQKTVHYSGDASESDARLLGDVLKKDRYFQDGGGPVDRAA